MLTLGLDTTGAHCTAALVSESEFLGQKSEDIGRGHAERLAPMVDELLTEEGVSPKDIGRIAVCTGPGSFTGLRVAIAFAKGFALPRSTPVIGLSALRVLAAQADPHKDKRVACVMDVRRGQLCWAAYDKGIETHSPLTEDIDAATAHLKALNVDRTVGDGAHYVAGPSQITIVSGTALAWISRHLDPAEFPPVPLYARAPDAKLPGGVTPT